MKRRLLTVFCLVCLLTNLLAFSVSAESSGDCGDNATWSLSDSGVLTISGSGAISDYIYSGANLWPNIMAPWRDYASKVKEVVINSGITRIGDNAFCCLPNVTSVSIANTVTSIGQAAFCDMKALTQITIPESVVEVEQSLFIRCTSLTTVKLPSGLKSLPGGMFKGCIKLESIELPKGITEIQGATFEGAGLTSITIPDGVTHIRTDAFQFCGSLKSVKLPNSLKKIGMCAFDSSAITSITIPKNVTHIVQYAFSGCYSLKSIRFEGDAPQMDSSIFEPITTTAYYPKDNPTWTEDVRQNYGGTIMWVAYCGNEHTWGQWETKRDATCAKEGLKIRACTQCDMTEEEIIATPAHQYTSVITPPTCKDDGFTTYTCKACNHTYTDSVTPAGPHAFGEWVVIKEATCLEKGSHQHSCIACNIQETEEIEPTGHTYQDVVTAPSCTQEGFTTHICTVCQHTLVDTYTESTGHAYRDEVTASSCTQEGFTTHICTVCQHTLVDTYTESTGHTYGEWVEIRSASWTAEGEQHRKCIDCAAEQTEVLPKLPLNWGLVIGIIVAGAAVGAGAIVAIVVVKKKHFAK